MSIKKRVIRKWRKNVFRYCTDVKEEILNKDDNGVIWPDKKDWGYAVDFECNGHSCSCADDSWYGVYKGAQSMIRYCQNNPPIWENQNELGLASSDSSLRESDASGSLPASSGKSGVCFGQL